MKYLPPISGTKYFSAVLFIYFNSNWNKVFLFYYENIWKILKKINKYSKILLLAASLVFLFQFATIPFVHNHPADLQNHYNCPAFILTITFVSFLTAIIIKINLSVPFLKRITFRSKFQHVQYVDRLTVKNKAPPF